jgi:GT2 family glycosyltransferase
MEKSTVGEKALGLSPLVSIVLLNWNGEQHVHRCLKHVISQDHRPIEVIVVDNGSVDGSLKRIKSDYRDFVYIENRKNRGFAVGMNQGIEASHGDFIVPLNQDVCLDHAFVSQCVARMQEDSTLGAIGGRVYCWMGDELTNRLRQGEGEQFFMKKRFQGDGGHFTNEPTLTFAPSGSFPFLRRSMLDDLRQTSGCYYDESYRTGWEDCDLWFRMHLLGWKCLFLPSAVGWHVGSGSVGGRATFFSKPLDYQVRVLRNRHFTIIKDLPWRTLLWLLPYLAATEFALIPYFLFRSPKSLLALVSAWWQVAIQLPVLLRKRAQIQKSKSVNHAYLKQYFIRF